MSRVLVTFLGKQFSRAGQASYLHMAYDMPDGTTTAPARYFAVELFGWLQRQGRRVDRLVVLGTATSMWASLMDLTASEDLNLWEAIERDSIAGGVSEAQLAAASAALGEALAVQVDCRLITAARSPDEQIALIETLRTAVAGCREVVLDVTHGYRHLPLIAAVAARSLEHTGAHEIESVYYGMEHDAVGPPGPGPRAGAAIDLGGLVRTLQISEGLATWQTTGRLTPLGNALEGILPEASKLGFFHDLRQHPRARQIAAGLRPRLKDPDHPVLRLLAPALVGVLDRIGSTRSPAHQQLDHAVAAHGHCDLPGMLIHLREAVAQHLALSQADETHRRRVRAHLGPQEFKLLQQLLDLRNAIAHGGASPQKRGELSDPARMDRTLQGLLAFARRTLGRPAL